MEIGNTTDVHGDDSDDDTMTRVNDRRQFSLLEQRFMREFNARGVSQERSDLMMTIKLFGATLPVPGDTLVWPARDPHDLSPDSRV